MEPVGIKQTQCPIELPVINFRQYRLAEITRCITRMYVNIRAVAAERVQVLCLSLIQIYKIEMIETRGDFQGPRWASFYLLPGSLRYVQPRTTECVDVELLYAVLVRKRFRIGRAVLLHDFKFQLGPVSNLIELEGSHHTSTTQLRALRGCSGRCDGSETRSTACHPAAVHQPWVNVLPIA